jgi:hypothetical protein
MQLVNLFKGLIRLMYVYILYWRCIYIIGSQVPAQVYQQFFSWTMHPIDLGKNFILGQFTLYLSVKKKFTLYLDNG